MDLPPPPSPGPLPFRDPAESFGGLQPDAAARLLAAGNDVTIVLDRNGIIRDIAVGSTDLGEDPFAAWIDRPFVETVAEDSRGKVEEMLQDVASRNAPRWRQVNHAAEGGQIPIRYLALEAGADGVMVAVGREMRTAQHLQQRMIQLQQAMERDYLRLRQTEQRYRLLFEESAEAVLVVDGQTRQVVEANPAAERLLAGRAQLVGQALPTLFAAADRDMLLQFMGAALSGASTPPRRIHLVDGREALVGASLFRQDRASLLLLRLSSADLPAEPQPLADVLDRIPDAFVLVDRQLRITAANPAFLDLTHLPRFEQARGEPIARFLARPDIDLDLMLAQLKAEGVLRNFETRLRTRNGGHEDVEISAVQADSGGETFYGLAIRVVARRLGRADETGDGVPRSVEQLTELVGRVSLKDIVRESTDLIERLCIEAALRYTQNNRASAAEILGLSRQSLYSKLHRHGLAVSGGDQDE